MNMFTRVAAKSLCLLSMLTATCSSVVLASEAELVWAENGVSKVAEKEAEKGVESRIMFSQLENDGWSKPLELYRSENPVTSLALVTDLKNTKILVWTEQFRFRSVLMKKQATGRPANWSKAELFSDYGKENFAATMVVDAANDIWLFWSANHGDLDDIYLLKRTSQGWGRPQRTHDQNKVPDILPAAQLDAAGNVSLDWRSYSLADGAYVTLNRVFELEKKWQNGYKSDPKEVPEITLKDVSLPDFVPADATALMHFPSNRMNQSEKIEPHQSSTP